MLFTYVHTCIHVPLRYIYPSESKGDMHIHTEHTHIPVERGMQGKADGIQFSLVFVATLENVEVL